MGKKQATLEQMYASFIRRNVQLNRFRGPVTSKIDEVFLYNLNVLQMSCSSNGIIVGWVFSLLPWLFEHTLYRGSSAVWCYRFWTAQIYFVSLFLNHQNLQPTMVFLWRSEHLSLS